MFNGFTFITAAIALFIAFFLLLLSMTQNINNAIWEYGVLRSMGLTKSEGSRVYMYEAFMIVIAASILGIAVGTLTALLIATQFFMFVELPLDFYFPYYMLTFLIVMAFVTTYLSVNKPIR